MSVTTTKQFATKQGERLLRGLTIQVARTIRAHGVNEVHDLRVAIRRYVRTLVVFKPCFPAGESRRMRRPLKRIMTQAGNVRDCDIAVQLIVRLRTPESGPMAQQLRERREQAAELLTGSLVRWTERKLSAAWRKAIAAACGSAKKDDRFCRTPIETTAKRILPEMAAELFRHGWTATHEAASVEEVHEFRIATKNLRYTLDQFAPLYGPPLAGMASQFKAVQGLLGDFNDCATVRRLVVRQKISKQPGGKEILAALKKRQKKKLAQFQKEFTPVFSDASTLKMWKEATAGRRPPS